MFNFAAEESFPFPSAVKLILNNKQAGSIIGKSGSEISTLEQILSVQLKFSPVGSFFPGTLDRVLVISGEIQKVKEAVNFVIEKIKLSVCPFDELALQLICIPLRIVVPNSAVGCLMGLGGRDVRALAQRTGVRVQISQRIPGLLERVVSVSGSPHQLIVAVHYVIDQIQYDPHILEHAQILVYSPQQIFNAEAAAILCNQKTQQTEPEKFKFPMPPPPFPPQEIFDFSNFIPTADIPPVDTTELKNLLDENPNLNLEAIFDQLTSDLQNVNVTNSTNQQQLIASILARIIELQNNTQAA